MKIKAWQIKENLKQLCPVYILSGDEPFQKEEACQLIRARARNAGFTEQLVYYADSQFEWRLLEEAANSLSLFSTQRLIELRLSAENKLSREAEAALSFYATHLPEETLLILVCDRLSKSTERNAWFKQLEQAGIWMPVWQIEGRHLISWLGDRMKASGIKASKEAVAVLAERTEGNLLAASQEIEKLVLLAPEGRVTLEHIRVLVSDSAHYDAFGLSEAVIAGNARHVVYIYRGLCAEGIDLSKLLWLLVRELRILNHLSRLLASGKRLDAAIELLAEKQKIPLFAVKRRRHEYLGCINRLGDEMICILMDKASRLDESLKTGKDKEVAEQFLTFILQMSGNNIKSCL